jgi:hypothetical protein
MAAFSYRKGAVNPRGEPAGDDIDSLQIPAMARLVQRFAKLLSNDSRHRLALILLWRV